MTTTGDVRSEVTQSAIHIDGMTRDFGPVRALDDLSLEVPAGTIFGFLGPNGAGKTTTIRLLLGLLEPTSGRAEVLGFDTRRQAEEIRARTGALLEHSGLYEQLTAEENLDFYGRVWQLTQGERGARVKELLDRMDLWDRRSDRVGTWSRGMKHKLALGRALLHRPPLVFLDEPTAGLDVVAANAVRDELAAMASRDGITVFLTTHNMAEAERLCNQVAVIREGSLIAVGRPDDLRAGGGGRVEIVGAGFDEDVLRTLRGQAGVSDAELHNDRLFVDLSGDIKVASLVSLLVGAGVQVEEVRKGAASLEEVFLTLMDEGEEER
jgi:ABC-2 type transport system ATP-binding protein